MSTPLSPNVQAAAQAGKILPSTVENLTAWWQGGLPAWAQQSIAELIEREQWAELNDRFYRYLEFGTGGMRGRTIGAVGAKAEFSVDEPIANSSMLSRPNGIAPAALSFTVTVAS